MAMRSSGLITSMAAKSLICIDGVKSADMFGRVYNPFMMEPCEFESVYQFIGILEDFFNEISFPQASCERRMFTPKPCGAEKKTMGVRRYMPDEIFEAERGKKATFVVQVQFRQNATWQGTISWTEEKKTQHFRSVLEMVRLMDEAVGQDAILKWE